MSTTRETKMIHLLLSMKSKNAKIFNFDEEFWNFLTTETTSQQFSDPFNKWTFEMLTFNFFQIAKKRFEDYPISIFLEDFWKKFFSRMKRFSSFTVHEKMPAVFFATNIPRKREKVFSKIKLLPSQRIRVEISKNKVSKKPGLV